MKFSCSILGLVLIAASTSANAEVTVADPWIRAFPPSIKVTAGYMSLINQGTQSVIIKSISSAQFGMVHIHDSVMQDGLMKMVPIHHAEIEQGSEFTLAPGAKHLMLMNQSSPLTTGDIVEIQFEFSDGTKLIVEAPVKKQ